ncbi:MAG: hypothetical protein F4Y45_15465 [Acidobacteria bacterium]|nr:hypothetical protein [Acidobacteriota bacterium]MYD70609.1 hypothetical protein [Acidobacteriota bacterium]MYJ03242.1 hypothetical protein [Acidobacteriota bacterium]
MSWWGWLIVGIVLIGGELMTDAAFYLVFAGAAAVVVGLLGLAGLALPVWAQWVAFSVLAIGLMVLFRRKLYDRLRGGLPELQHPAVGAVVVVTEEVAPGGRTRVRLQGTDWNAVNSGATSIAAGADARVVEADGVELRIAAHTPENRER